MAKYCDRMGTPRMLRHDSYADHANKQSQDYSAFIRVYSSYLDERFTVYRATKFDPHRVRRGGLQGEGVRQNLSAGGSIHVGV